MLTMRNIFHATTAAAAVDRECSFHIYWSWLCFSLQSSQQETKASRFIVTYRFIRMFAKRTRRNDEKLQRDKNDILSFPHIFGLCKENVNFISQYISCTTSFFPKFVFHFSVYPLPIPVCLVTKVLIACECMYTKIISYFIKPISSYLDTSLIHFVSVGCWNKNKFTWCGIHVKVIMITVTVVWNKKWNKNNYTFSCMVTWRKEPKREQTTARPGSFLFE